MEQRARGKSPNKIKKFFTKLFDNIDKKMEEKAKSKPCCCGSNEGENKSCCS